MFLRPRTLTKDSFIHLTSSTNICIGIPQGIIFYVIIENPFVSHFGGYESWTPSIHTDIYALISNHIIFNLYNLVLLLHGPIWLLHVPPCVCVHVPLYGQESHLIEWYQFCKWSSSSFGRERQWEVDFVNVDLQPQTTYLTTPCGCFHVRNKFYGSLSSYINGRSNILFVWTSYPTQPILSHRCCRLVFVCVFFINKNMHDPFATFLVLCLHVPTNHTTSVSLCSCSGFFLFVDRKLINHYINQSLDHESWSR